MPCNSTPTGPQKAPTRVQPRLPTRATALFGSPVNPPTRGRPCRSRNNHIHDVLQVLFRLLGFLSPEDLTAAAQTCSMLRIVASDDLLWRRLFAARWQGQQPDAAMPHNQQTRQHWKVCPVHNASVSSNIPTRSRATCTPTGQSWPRRGWAPLRRCVRCTNAWSRPSARSDLAASTPCPSCRQRPRSRTTPSQHGGARTALTPPASGRPCTAAARPSGCRSLVAALSAGRAGGHTSAARGAESGRLTPAATCSCVISPEGASHDC